MTTSAEVVPWERLELVCPACRGSLEFRGGDSLHCGSCGRSFPVLLGIPDLRLWPDPYIGMAEDRAKALRLARDCANKSFVESVAHYYRITTGVPEAQASMFVRGLMTAASRADAELDAWSALDPSATNPTTLLDVGCGTAPLLQVAATRYDGVKTLAGLDIAFRWLVLARKRLDEAGLDVPLVCACAEALPFPDAAFSHVVAASSLELMRDQNLALRECGRVLEGRGKIFISTPNRFSLGPDPHTGVWGGGFLPDRLTRAYVRRMGGVPPVRRMLSGYGLRRLLRRAGFEEIRLGLPAITAAQRRSLSGLAKRLVPVYDRVKAATPGRLLLKLLGPSLLCVARKPAVTLHAVGVATWVALSGCGAGAPRPETMQPLTVAVDTLARFQIMTGWEAVAQAGQGEPGFVRLREDLMDQAAELGINRLRLEVRPGSENTLDYFLQQRGASDRCARVAIENDNDDPNVINPAGFRFTELDSAVVNVVLPLKRRLQARGEQLFLSLNYVAFLGQCQPRLYVHADPAEYAEFVLAAFLHLRSSYGLVPDAMEIILEPDLVGPPWSGKLIGEALVATAQRLAAAGFRPVFVAPSTTDLANAVPFTREILRVPGAAGLLDEMSYHRYRGVSDRNLREIAEFAAEHGLRTAMLEHIGSGADNLYKDLTLAQVSAWQQYTLAFTGEDNGGKYFRMLRGRVIPGDRTRYLGQYFRYVRYGAQRVGATTTSPLLRAVAFQNLDRRLVVVLNTGRSLMIRLTGLPPGQYGATITTARLTGADLGVRAAGADGELTVPAPAAGVLTVYAR